MNSQKCQQLFCIKVEYLDVYKPNEKEIQDPMLYAQNVRKVMANSLGIPIVNRRLEDGKALMASRNTLHNVVIDDELEQVKKRRFNYVDFTGNLNLLS
jgi:hypothetical protein